MKNQIKFFRVSMIVLVIVMMIFALWLVACAPQATNKTVTVQDQSISEISCVSDPGYHIYRCVDLTYKKVCYRTSGSDSGAICYDIKE